MTNPIKARFRLGFPWQTQDPFLFCVHHLDHYPKGDAQQAPIASMQGRQLGSDFSGKDGFSMYHGHPVPGFPQHPHRGFETITIARQGFIDHSDSLGATARFGAGDVQWMTAGRGVVHSEMFPMRNQDSPNTTELFQIWLNLPAKSKLVPAHFTMFWRDQVPYINHLDDQGKRTQIMVVAGPLEDAQPLAPPPDSWAASPKADVAIWSITMEPGATWTMPAASSSSVKRSLFFFAGERLKLADQDAQRGQGLSLDPTQAVTLHNDAQVQAELLMLQGAPIGEPVAQHGPFVMNTQRELQQAFMDYQRTGFGGWPFKAHGPVHPREQDRFAVHADGRREDAGP